jgi:NAD(P)-dependent dehydrogenase (short-subunit alcohol dehydrogenase family)
MTNTKPLEGRVAIVAGASRGAGRGIAAMLGEAGATVYCTGRSEGSQYTARLVTEHGGTGIHVRVDHTIADEVRALLQRVTAEHGRLDVLVNNVNGDDLYEWKPFWKQSMENGLQCMQRGIHSHLLTIHAAIPLMLERRSGLIVSITDQGGGTFFYGFVKQSVMRICELLAPELVPGGVTAVSLTPGFLRSEAVLARYGVEESNWRDAIKKDPFFAASETPFYVGRAVAALAADPKVILKAGTLLSSWTLAEEYGFTDLDGSRPNVDRVFTPLIDERWDLVVKAMRSEFERHGVDPDATLELDRKGLAVSARLSSQEPVKWLKEVLGPPGVVYSNPGKIADAFYQRFARLR